MRISTNTFEPTGSQSAGTPSAELVSDVGSRASAGIPTDDSDLVEGVAGARPPRGGLGAEPPMGEPLGSPSSLDTYDITRPTNRRSVGLSPDRARYVQELGEATTGHRRAKRKDHVQRAAMRRREARAAGYSEGYAEEKTRWHQSRAKGQELRPEKAATCGEDIIRVSCTGCGVQHDKPGKCRLPLWCVRCRGALASHRRARFLASRKVVLDGALSRKLLGLNVASRTRWSEKLLTLTFPHVAEHTIQERIQLAFATWSIFLKFLNKWARSKNIKSMQWFRAFEWESGSDRLGHPHFHVWIFSPYLNRDELVAWLGTAYERASGAEVRSHTILDVRELKGRERDAQEIIKYITKDIDAKGRLIPPAVFAEAYKAIDGKRLTQASSGFMSLGANGKGFSCVCGSTECNVERIKSEVER